MEGLAEVASLVAKSEVILVTSYLTRVEILECTLAGEAKKLFDDFFKRRNRDLDGIRLECIELIRESVSDQITDQSRRKEITLCGFFKH